MKPILRQTLPLTALIAATAVSIAPSARAEVPATCVKGVDLATLGPKSIVGQGPHGEKAASPEVLALSDAEAAKIRDRHFKVGISMQTVNLDWSQLQIQGITDTLKKYGVDGDGRRVRRVSGRQADRRYREHDPAASGRHHLDPGRFHRDRADLQEDRQGRHQAGADGQHSRPA